MAIAALGVGSNLDAASLVENLMSVERIPLQKLDQREAATQVKISAYGTLRGALSAFQSTVAGFKEATRFVATRGTSSANSAISVSAGATASAGSYSVEVSYLAQSHKIASSAFAATDTVVGSGTLTIEHGTYDSTGNTFTALSGSTPKLVTISTEGQTLSQIRDGINAANAGVSASIVNDGTGHRLVLTSSSSGAEHSLRVTVSDADGNGTDAAGLSQLAYDPTATAGTGKNLSQLIAARDAVFTVDGLPVHSSSNTVSNVIEGVTLTLQQTNVGTPTTISVVKDTGSTKAALESFVKAYNDLQKTLKDAGNYDAASKKAGALQSEAALRGLASNMRNLVTGTVSTVSGAYNSLASVGIAFERDGTLKLDSTRLDKALAADPAAVQRLFSGRDPLTPATATPKGLAHALDTALTDMLDSDGAISARTKGLERLVKDISQQRERVQTRLAATQKRYERQFGALDSFLTGMQQTSSYLAQQIANLNNG